MEDLMIDLEGIKARCDATSYGPWEVENGDVVSVGNNGTRVVEGMQRHWHAMISQLGRTLSIETCLKYAERDIDFIASARQDIPALLSEIERLREFKITSEQADRELEEKVARLKEIERLKKERDDAYEDARSKQERMQRVIDGSRTLAAECAELRKWLAWFVECSEVDGYERPSAHPDQMRGAKAALSSPSTAKWAEAFEALVKEHDVIERHGWVPSEVREVSDATESALAALEKGE